MARKTQKQRRHDTQQAVLTAVLQVLSETGYANFSVVAVARRAGVTRGALEHYFPGKSDLLIAASQYMIENAIEQAREEEKKGAHEPDAIRKFLTNTRGYFLSDAYRGMVELAIAMRADPQLSKVHDEIVMSGRTEIDRIWHDILVSAGYPQERVRLFIDLTDNLLRGLFLTRTWLPLQPDVDMLLKAWEDAAPSFLGNGTSHKNKQS